MPNVELKDHNLRNSFETSMPVLVTTVILNDHIS